MVSLYFLSCSTPAVMMLQLLACLAHVQLLAACKLRATCEIQSRVPIFLHNLEQFFSLSYTLSLHDSHLNTGLLIAKIQTNLTQNKANKMIDKIQPYIDKKKTLTLIYVQTLNTKKVGKKIFSHISNHITFSPNLLLLLVLSHYIHLHPFHCSIFFSQSLFSVYYSQHFSCGSMLWILQILQIDVLSIIKKNSFKHLFIILFKCHIFLSHQFVSFLQ